MAWDALRIRLEFQTTAERAHLEQLSIIERLGKGEKDLEGDHDKFAAQYDLYIQIAGSPSASLTDVVLKLAQMYATGYVKGTTPVKSRAAYTEHYEQEILRLIRTLGKQL
jgi:hypothetical protein